MSWGEIAARSARVEAPAPAPEGACRECGEPVVPGKPLCDTHLRDALLTVIEGVELTGRVNVENDEILSNIRSAIRRQHQQCFAQPLQADRIALVGSGPSLADTTRELVALIHEGAKLVTVNGAYHWALSQNLKPSAHVVLDARASNARFVEPAVPGVKYFLASQCAPAMWDAVEGRDHVYIFHAVNPDEREIPVLDDYYLKQWQGIPGGTTVMCRALSLFRTLGYLRFDVFGMDSCWLGEQHHAFPQPENDRDRRLNYTVTPTGHPELARTFVVSPWHLKQLEDFLQFIRINGDQVLLNVHGNGLIAFALSVNAELAMAEEA
jgi:hypothetical protein